jgi:hypothetical protein|tara:strand:- start:788 stop:2233 length:1446 start_codon:yes stop_codon:yes gene_type:complete
MQVPFGEWLPDIPDHLNKGATTATNVFPAAVSYKPFKASQQKSNALDSQCFGAFSTKDNSANVYTFAGTKSKLYKLSGETFSDVSQASTTYNAGADNFWSFSNFGTTVVASNGEDTPQKFVVGTSSVFADLGGSPPIFTFSAVIRDFLVVGRIKTVKNRVQWSGINDVETWTSGTKQSDYQDLADGGEITGIVGGEYGYIFQENQITRMDYVGGTTVFRFSVISKNRGAIFAKAITQVGKRVFFYAQDGFFEIDGETIRPIGQHKVNDYFESNLSAGYQQNIIASTDPLNHLAIWSYPSTAATTGVQDRLLIYNYSVNRWSVVETAAEMIFLQFSEAYTVDTLDNVSNSLDDLNVSFDSRYWLGGVVNFAGFDGDHKLIQFDGDTLAATIETGEIEPSPGRRSTVTMVRPIVDGTSTARVTSRARAADSGTSTSYASLQTNGDIPVRSSGRYHKVGVAIAAAASWNDAQGVDLIAVSAGNR